MRDALLFVGEKIDQKKGLVPPGESLLLSQEPQDESALFGGAGIHLTLGEAADLAARFLARESPARKFLPERRVKGDAKMIAGNSMDLQTFYQHALQWQSQEEAAERQAALQREQNIREAWKAIALLIREALPLQGMTIHETAPGQFDQLPSILCAVDCQIDPARRAGMETPQYSGRAMDGVIRVQLEYDAEQDTPGWAISHYQVWAGGECRRFDSPYAAFLAAFENLRGQIGYNCDEKGLNLEIGT